MKQTSKRLISIIFALLFAAVALVVFFDFIEPEYANVLNLKAQAAGEDSLLASATQSVQQVQALVNDYKNQSRNVAAVALAMPTGEDLAGALAQIYGLAQINSIAIQSVGISAPSLQLQKASSTQVAKPVGTISFQVTAAGSYENLKNFLSGLETNIRIFDLKSISISPPQGANGLARGAGQDFFTYNFTVAGYYQTPITNNQ